jgi:2-methylcitrate dehydratase PrpD
MYQINAREFIEDASEWIYDLSINHIPSESIDHAKIMLIDTIGASLASLTTSYGRQVVLDFFKDDYDLPKVLSMLSVLLDYDSTLLYYGHLGHGILASIIYYILHNKEVSGEKILEAVIGASEITARVAASLSFSETRGQMMSSIHALSTAILLSKLSDSSPHDTLNSINYALSILLKPTKEGFATVAKSLVALTGFMHGLNAYKLMKTTTNSIRVFEGFLNAWGGHIIKAPFGGLGKRWHINTLSVKKYPACSYAQTAIESALKISNYIKPDAIKEIKRIIIKENFLTYHMDQRFKTFIDNKRTSFTALQFYTPYLIAYTLLYKNPEPQMYETKFINDNNIWNLILKTETIHDLSLTRLMLKEPLPFGIALHELKFIEKIYLLLKLGGVKVLKMIFYPEVMHGYDINEVNFNAVKKIMSVEIEIKTRKDVFNASTDIVDGFHGTGINNKRIISIKKLNYLKSFINDDEFYQTLDILQSIEKANYDDLKTIINVILKATRSSIKNVKREQ